MIARYGSPVLTHMCLQMGSHYKHSIFGANVKHSLHIWRKTAKKRLRHGTSSSDPSSHDGSTLSPRKRGTDDSSPEHDEPSFETIHEHEIDNGFEVISGLDPLQPRVASLQHFLSTPQHSSFPSRQISIDRSIEGRPFLAETPRPSYSRAKVVPNDHARKVSRTFHKQLSFSSTSSGSTDSESGYIELLNLQK
jgi:hypothetical protein